MADTQGVVFAPFAGIEKNDDGSRTVYGLVSDESIDTDGQIADLNWVRSQMPEWSKWSNIREMHRPSAVGVGKGIEDTGDAIYVEAKIVDADAIKKIDEGVYKGYSIGIRGLPGNPYKVVKDAVAKNGRIVGGAIVEISICDRPANPNAAFMVVKNVAALEKEAADAATLAQAAALIRSVYAPSTEADKSASVSVGVSVNTTSAAYAGTYEEALGQVLQALGLAPQPPVDGPNFDPEPDNAYKAEGSTCATCGHEPGCGCECCDSTKTATSTPEEEIVDKVQLGEVLKTLTAEERIEFGLAPASADLEELEALKTTVAEQALKIEELGKAVAPTAVHAGPAMPTAPRSQELDALKADAATFQGLVDEASDPMTVQFAQRRVNEINKAIEAAQTA